MQVLDCRVREMGLRLLGGAPKFFLVQLRGHSALHFLILCSMAPWVRFWLWRMLVLFLPRLDEGGFCTSLSSASLTSLRGLRSEEGRRICLSGLVWGSPPTHCIITVAFYFLLFVTLLASALRAEQVEDLGGHIVRYTHLGNFEAFWMWSSLEWQ